MFQERGGEKLTDEILENAVASTVNLAEVQSKLVKKGYNPEEAWEDALSLVKRQNLSPASKPGLPAI